MSCVRWRLLVFPFKRLKGVAIEIFYGQLAQTSALCEGNCNSMQGAAKRKSQCKEVSIQGSLNAWKSQSMEVSMHRSLNAGGSKEEVSRCLLLTEIYIAVIAYQYPPTPRLASNKCLFKFYA